MKRSRHTTGRPVQKTVKARARAAADAGAARRVSGHHCPLCLEPLPRIGARKAQTCAFCTAREMPGKRCAKCSREAIWEAGARAACQACGNHGSRVAVVAGDVAEPRLAAPELFAVLRERGPAFDKSRPLEQQRDWDAHAAFMEGLVDDGVVVLGGPLRDTGEALVIFRAKDEDEIHARLARDPWTRQDLLRTVRCAPWTLRLGSLQARKP